MITKRKIELYKKYAGNIESWNRFGKTSDKQIMTYEEWELIDELVHNLELIEKGLASDSFKIQTFKKLHDACDSEKTKREVIALVGKFE